MNGGLFRKSSIDRVSSPEQLNDYIRVATPAVWLILSAVVILLAGIIVWGIFGTVETKIDGVLVCDNGRTVCLVKSENGASLKEGMKIEANGITGEIASVSAVPAQLDEKADSYIIHVGGFLPNDFCTVAEVKTDSVKEGIYSAKITVDSVHPIMFVIQ